MIAGPWLRSCWEGRVYCSGGADRHIHMSLMALRCSCSRRNICSSHKQLVAAGGSCQQQIHGQELGRVRDGQRLVGEDDVQLVTTRRSSRGLTIVARAPCIASGVQVLASLLHEQQQNRMLAGFDDLWGPLFQKKRRSPFNRVDR